ncbi:MAG: alpha/beta hydrolase [Longimicrobiales bacterium]
MTAREEHITVAKTARYYVLGEPGPGTRELWLCCHGYGQLASRFIQHFAPIASEQRVIVAAEALHRFYLDPPDRPAPERRVGATWMTREDRAADMADYVRYLDTLVADLLRTVPGNAQLLALGFSQGTATVTRWAAATERQIARLILWGSGLPPDLDWSAVGAGLRRARVTLVAGAADAQMPSLRWAEQEKLLTSQKIAFERIDFDGGHHLDAATLLRLTVG